MTRELTVVGLNHRTAPVTVRERLALPAGEMGTLLEDLVALPSVHEAVVLSTCNRVEVVACCAPGVTQGAPLADRLFRDTELEPRECSSLLYEHQGRDAVRHLFRVAASLDSMVVGEPQILGQMKEQFEFSAGLDTAGPVLHRVFDKSFSVAKRVRSETAIADRTVSVAATAVDLAGRIFDSLEDRAVLLIGAGDTGETAARHFLRAGIGQLMVANRTFDAAVELARELEGTPIPLDRMSQYLPMADLVVGAAGGGEIIDARTAAEVIAERRDRPVFFIDLAVPRNFDPAINDVDNAYLYDMDDLSAVVEENLGERALEAKRGEAIVDSEVETFWRWFERLDVVPTIVDLRQHAEQIRVSELERTLARMDGLTDSHRDAIEQMTRAMVNKLLHQPTSVLKSQGSQKDESHLATAIRRLFGLEGGES